MSLVVIGAHAMDAELMAGPLAAVAADAGWPVALLHLTLGERGHPDKPPEIFGVQLREESATAARVLGVDVAWSGATAPLDAAVVVPWLVEQLRARAATFVVTHWEGSWHPSHRAAHHAVHRAIAAVASPMAIAYGENCEDLDGFRPSYVVPVAAVRQRWLDAAGAYELFRRSIPGSGVEASIPYWAYYTAALRVHGLHWGLEQAQALMTADPLPDGLGIVRVGDAPLY